MIAQKYGQITLENKKEILTGKGGLSWIHQCMQHFGVEKVLRNRARRKAKSNREIPYFEKMMAGILMVIGGGERIEDIETLRSDSGLVKSLGWKSIICPDTFLNFLKPKQRGKQLLKINEDMVIEGIRRSETNELTYDNDATYINSKKNCAQYSYQKEKQVSGLLGYISEVSGLCITADFRPGNISPADGILEQIKAAVRIVEASGKRVSRFRSDSAAHQFDIFQYCETEAICYFVSLDKNAVVVREVRCIAEKSWKPLPDNPDKEWAEFTHAMARSKKEKIAMRALVLRWKNPDPTLFERSAYCYHIIGTNDWKIKPLEWLKVHNGRMNSENFHKEIKSNLAGGYIPSHRFSTCASFFAINVLAYNIIQLMKIFYLKNNEKKWTVKTLRFRFINTVIRLTSHARKTTCQIINATQETFQLFQSSWRSLNWSVP